MSLSSTPARPQFRFRLRFRFRFQRPALLAAVLFGLRLGSPSVGANGQALTGATPTANPTRIDLYAGYAYFHPLSGSIDTLPYLPIQPGAVASLSFYFTRHLGVQVEGNGFPQGSNDSFYTAQAGPIARFSIGRVSPFVHALGGLAKVSGPAQQAATWGWGLTGGAGVDYIVPGFNHQLAIRPIQADYQFSHVDFGALASNGQTGGLSEVRAYRLSAGLVFRFGGDTAKGRPLMYGCTLQPTTIYAGDPITVTGSFVSTARHARSTYTWASSGGRITGADETASVATEGLSPGEYTVTGHLSVGKHLSENATCKAAFAVVAPAPPTISCAATPVAVAPGGQAIINTMGTSPQGRRLSYSYSSSAGQIVNNGPAATLSTAGVSPGPIHIGCRVTDDLGQGAEAATLVSVNAPPAPIAVSRDLCTLTFNRDLRRPTRVDNEAKACLDDVALTLNRNVEARLAIRGDRAPGEDPSIASARAINARTYLTQEKGIDPSRIDIRAGTLQQRAAEITLIPVGAPVPLSDDIRPSPGSRGRSIPDETGAGTTYTAPAVPAVPADSSNFTPSPGTYPGMRPADSLVLPPLPGDALAGKPPAKPRRRSPASPATATRRTRSKHRVAQRPAPTPGGAAASTTGAGSSPAPKTGTLSPPQ